VLELIDARGKCLTFAVKTSCISGNFPDNAQEVAVNRTELVDAVARQAGLDKKQAEAAVVAVANSVVTQTRAGNKVAIFGFGTFSPTQRKARTGRNPQTGAPVKIAASKSVKFAPATAFKEALNSRAKAGAAKKAAPAKKAGAAKKAPAKKAVKAAKKR
jgi:nucleoid DNA-binding protein